MAIGYQYRRGGGFQNMRELSPYRSLFPNSGTLLLQLLQQRRAQQLLEQEDRKRGREIAESTWKEAVKYDPNPARSEYKEYFSKQTEDLMNIASNVRKGVGSPDDVYLKMKAIQSDATKVERFDKELTGIYTRLKESGIRDLREVDKIMAEAVYNTQLTGQMGGKVVKAPGDLNIDEVRTMIENATSTYSPAKMTESFVKNVIEPAMVEVSSNIAGPQGTTIRSTKKTLPASFTDGSYTSAARPRIIVGEPGSPTSNRLLAHWDALSPDHARYLDLMVKQNNPDLDFSNAKASDVGILRQAELQKILDANGHIDAKTVREQVFYPDRSGAPSSGDIQKEKLLDSKAKVVYDIFTGSHQDVEKNLTNLMSADGKQKVQYNPIRNIVTIVREKGVEYNPMTGKMEEIPGSVVPIDLNDPKKAIPLLNDAWQRVSPVKGEVDTQALMGVLFDKFKLENRSYRNAPEPPTAGMGPNEKKVEPPPAATDKSKPAPPAPQSGKPKDKLAGRVKMRSPDGRDAWILKDQVELAKESGFTELK